MSAADADNHEALAAAISAIQKDMHAMRDLTHRTSLGHDQRLLRAEKAWREEAAHIRDELNRLVDLISEFTDADHAARLARQAALDRTLADIRRIAIAALVLSMLNVVLWFVTTRIG